MADITMCTQVLCPNASICYRFRAIPNPQYQSFCAFKYEVKCSGVVCEYFMPMPKENEFKL